MAKLEVLLDNTWMVICNLARASLARVDASSSHLPLTCHCICWWKWIGWRWWFDLSSLYLCLSYLIFMFLNDLSQGQNSLAVINCLPVENVRLLVAGLYAPYMEAGRFWLLRWQRHLSCSQLLCSLPCSLVASLGLVTVHKTASGSTRQN